MDSYYYLAPAQHRSLIDAVAALAPLGFSLVAIAISFWVARKQIAIQKRQLNQDLFDRRFVVYIDTRDFINYVRRNDGKIDLQGVEYAHFLETVEKAEMLFAGDSVFNYLTEIQTAAMELYVYASEQEKAVREGDSKRIRQAAELKKHLYDGLRNRRNEVFGQQLKLDR